jgi:hypothetical protein
MDGSRPITPLRKEVQIEKRKSGTRCVTEASKTEKEG